VSENKDHPIVSIILPTYNRADLIVETIASILNQTYQRWELIIIDDGSEDNTEEIVTQIKDERIQFHKAGRIGIVGKIKNIGIEKATGELLAFIDSDDLWAETKLEKQIAALQLYPEAGFSLTGGYNFRNNLETVDYFYKKTDGFRYDNLFYNCFTSEVTAFTQALMLHKNCVDKAGMFIEEKTFSDVEFICNLAYNFKGVILYEPLVYRRLHDENYINPNWEKSFYEGIAIIQSYRDKLPPEIWRNALFRSYINFGEKCLRYKKRRKAINNFLNAWQHKILSIVPIKKIIKTFFYYLKRK